MEKLIPKLTTFLLDEFSAQRESNKISLDELWPGGVFLSGKIMGKKGKHLPIFLG
jgi:hypothetical protein